MAKQFSDIFTQANKRLFDLLFRHQLYLEGVKSGFAGDFRDRLNKLYDRLAKFFRTVRYSSMDGFTKGELQQFIFLLNQEQVRFYSEYTQQLIKQLRIFLSMDVIATHAMMEDVTGRLPLESKIPRTILTKDEYAHLPRITQTEYVQRNDGDFQIKDPKQIRPTPLYGIAVTHSDPDSNNKLWAKVINDPIPGVGFLMLAYVESFAALQLAVTEQLLWQSWSNNWTVEETLQRITWSKVAELSGAFDIAETHASTMINTIFQHENTFIQSAIASAYTEWYQWVSILDNRTTLVCWNRNGIVYKFDEGPKPPAHYNCRSKIVPLLSDVETHEIPGGFFDWLENQPDSILQDILTKAQLEKFNSGELKTAPQFIRSIKPLTLDQFRTKLKYILEN